jgi:hypothetical protein
MMVVLAACGDDDRGFVADASHPPVPVDAGLAIATPAAPAAPVEAVSPSWTCPAGWRVIELDGLLSCDPWPMGAHRECPTGSAHFPGTADCAPLGTPCSDDTLYATDLPTDRSVLYVASGAAPGGIGSLEAPFGTIGDAIAAAAAGTVIAIAKGRFEEQVTVGAGITLWGACPEETRLVHLDTNTGSGTVIIAGDDAAVRNLSIQGENVALVSTGRGEVHGVAIEDSAVVGWAVLEGASVRASRVSIRATRSTSDGRYGRGLHVGESTLEGTHFEIVGNREAALVVEQATSTVALTDVVLSRTEPRTSDGLLGGAVGMRDGATVTLERFAIESNHHDGVLASGAGTQLVLRDGVLRDTAPPPTAGPYGSGLFATSGARVEIARARFERNTAGGILAQDEGTLVAAEDVWLAEGEARPDEAGGLGIQVKDGARLELERAVLARNQAAGLVVGARATADIRDVSIHDTRSSPDGSDGRGVSVESGGHLTASRMHVVDSREHALFVKASTAIVRDLIVRDTRVEASSGQFGRAVGAIEGATLTVERAVLERSHEVGVFVHGATTEAELSDIVVSGGAPTSEDSLGPAALATGVAATYEGHLRLTRAAVREVGLMGIQARGAAATIVLTDVTVTDLAGHQADGTFGHGIQAEHGGLISATTVSVERARGAGVVAIGTDARIEATDIRVEETLRRRCNEAGACPDELGVGVVAAARGFVRLESFVVSDNTLCGGQVAAEGVLELTRGVIARQPIGINVQLAAFDYDSIAASVAFVDNDQNLQTDRLPVPAATPSDLGVGQ